MLKKEIIKKEIPTQVFSYQFCKIFKNTFFARTTPDDCSCTVNLNLIALHKFGKFIISRVQIIFSNQNMQILSFFMILKTWILVPL